MITTVRAIKKGALLMKLTTIMRENAGRITLKKFIAVVASLAVIAAVTGSVALARRSAPPLAPFKSLPISKNSGVHRGSQPGVEARPEVRR
jgi:hypothetical protein